MGVARREYELTHLSDNHHARQSSSSLGFSIFSRYLPKYSLEQLIAVSDQRRLKLDNLIASIQLSVDKMSITRDCYMGMVRSGRVTLFDLYADCSYSPVIKDWLSHQDSFWLEQLQGELQAFDCGEGSAMTRWMKAFHDQHVIPNYQQSAVIVVGR